YILISVPWAAAFFKPQREGVVSASPGRRFCKIHVESREKELHDRPHEDRERNRADSEGAAQHPADCQHSDLEHCSGETDRWSSPGDAGHEAVTRSRSEMGTNVQTGTEPDDQDPARH